MSSGPEAGTPRGQNWAAVEQQLERMYPEPAPDHREPRPASDADHQKAGRDDD